MERHSHKGPQREPFPKPLSVEEEVEPHGKSTGFIQVARDPCPVLVLGTHHLAALPGGSDCPLLVYFDVSIPPG